jgi:hypothetical protein
MIRTWMILIVASLVLSGCARIQESRFNPFNWFSRSERVEDVVEGTNPLIPTAEARSLFASRPDAYDGIAIDAIASIRLDPTPGGAILLAFGASAAQGAYDVRLVRDETEEDEDILAYDFKLRLPERPRPGPQRIVAAQTLTKQDLATVKEIHVRAGKARKIIRP